MPSYRTPLRYPGGKQRLAPFLVEVLAENRAVDWNYVEPYAGGAGAAMELLLNNRVGHVYLNDSSFPIYAFWKALRDNPEHFCRRISRASLNLVTWKKHREVLRSPHEHTIEDVGFSTFYLNRCNHSGVLTAGVIGGLKQDGPWRIDARFPRNQLIQRVEAIAQYRDRITLSNIDAETFLGNKVSRLSKNTLIYCDPPYFARAKRLYLNIYEPADHQRLAHFMQTQVSQNWLVSYDNHPTILRAYSKRRTFCYSLQYSAMKVYAGREVFVFSDRLKIPTTSILPYLKRPLASIHRSA